MTMLDDLPPELIGIILEVMDPGSHLDFALTSHYLHATSRDVLARHRRYFIPGKVVSDIQPTTIPQLLRNVLKDHIAAYYVQHLEIWGYRTSWYDWKPYEFRIRSGQRVPWPSPQRTYSSDFFTEHELDNFCRIMQRQLHFDEEQSLKWRALIKRGDDGALKGLLVALAPWLHSLTFVAYGNWADTDNDVTSDSCYNFLALEIRKAHAQAQWAPGLLALRDVTLGVSTASRDVDDSDATVPDKVALECMRLPNIHSLSIYDLRGTLDDGKVDRYYQNASSSLRHLCLDTPDDHEERLLAKMVAMSRALESLVIHGTTLQSADGILESLVSAQSATLTHLILYSVAEDRPGRSGMALSWLPKLPASKTVMVDGIDAASEAYSDSLSHWNIPEPLPPAVRPGSGTAPMHVPAEHGNTNTLRLRRTQ